MRRTLLDTCFPVEEVSRNAAAEKSARQGHLSTLFFWFARRPTGLSRSAIFAAALPDDVRLPPELVSQLGNRYAADAELRENLVKLIGELSRWDAYRDDELMGLARTILDHAGERSLIDTFAGGGSIPLEGLRLGFDTRAADLNPVAAVALKCALEVLPRAPKTTLVKFDRIVDELRAEARERLSHLYALPGLAQGQDLLAIFWSRTYECPSCRWTVPLIRGGRLGKESHFVLVPDRSQGRILTKVASRTTESASVVTTTGATCPNCATKIAFSTLAEMGRAGTIGEMPTAYVVRAANKKLYRSLTDEDREFLTVEIETSARMPSIALDRNGIRHLWAMAYGVETTADLFSARQKHALATLLEAAELKMDVLSSGSSDLDVEVVALLLSALFMRLVTLGSRHTWWQSNGEFPANAFGRQALPMVWDFVEIPAVSPGAAGLNSGAEWVRRAAVELLGTGHAATSVERRDAASSAAPTGSVSLVAIDPPYYDTITYSYLADCFYPVFQSLLGKRLPDWFAENRADRMQEAIVDRTHKQAPSPKGDDHFREKMAEALAEADRALKPDGRLLIMYGHKQMRAWIALFSAFEGTGLVPVSCTPVTSERSVKFRHAKVAHLSTSCLLSAAKLPPQQGRPHLDWLVYLKSIQDDQLLLEATSEIGTFNPADPMSRVCAAAALYLSTNVSESDGLAVTLDDALAEAWAISERL